MGKFLHDFKEFALKGNVIDMAVGVIVGGAFGKIVSSLVNDILMPSSQSSPVAMATRTLNMSLPRPIRLSPTARQL